jgi:hypothetical protein
MDSQTISRVSTKEVLSSKQQPAVVNTAKTKETIGALPGFLIGGAAACAAVTFSNPWEVS